MDGSVRATEIGAADRGASGLVGAPAVIARLGRAEDLVRFLAGPSPSNLLFGLDGQGNVLDGAGNAVAPLPEVYEKLAGKILPVVCVADGAAARKFVEIWNTRLSDPDMAVLSADEELLRSVRTAIPCIRGVYDLSGKELPDPHRAVAAATRAMAHIVLLSEEQSTRWRVRYFQSRFKAVWTEPDGRSEDLFVVQSVVSAGPYGIVGDPALIRAAYGEYPAHSLARTSLNIAHRGLPYLMAENSLAGALRAVEAGASHVEIDVYLTKDGRVAVMHDSTLARTTDAPASAAVEEMTLEEIGRYPITKTLAGETVHPEPVPVLEAFYEAFAKKDTVLVIEIKSRDPAILGAIAELTERYGFWDRIVFISFDTDILDEARKRLPQVPTANLNSFPRALFAANAAKYNALNTVTDAPIEDMTDVSYYDAMKDRGYMSYIWQYATAEECVAAQAKGAFGLTNNRANDFGGRVCAVHGKSGVLPKSALVRGGRIGLVLRTYAGKESCGEGKIFAVRDRGAFTEVIACYEEGEDKIFSPVFRIDHA